MPREDIILLESLPIRIPIAHNGKGQPRAYGTHGLIPILSLPSPHYRIKLIAFLNKKQRPQKDNNPNNNHLGNNISNDLFPSLTIYEGEIFLVFSNVLVHYGEVFVVLRLGVQC